MIHTLFMSLPWSLHLGCIFEGTIANELRGAFRKLPKTLALGLLQLEAVPVAVV